MKSEAKRGLLAWLCAGLWALSCASTRENPTGGETHFLTRCDASDPSACGSSLSCVCGVCTVACSERSECNTFPIAECVQPTASSCPSVAAHCDVPCAADVDCSLLSKEHRCLVGVCRAEAPHVTPGDGGAPPTACARGEVAANQVLVVGDSFFASSHQITAYLEDLARSAGALPAGERYRDNSRLAANGLAVAGNGILDQYTAASAEAPVEVVVMNGGGADVLLGACETPDETCPALAAAADGATALFAQLAADGVDHVIYVFYPDPVDANVRARMDALRPLVESACAQSPVACEWLDLRQVFAGHYADYVQNDGLNPTASGSEASAAAIWAIMQQRCIAQ